MAAPSEVAAAVLGEGDGGGFGSWLDGRLEALGVDRAVYAAYILGVLQEEEEEEKLDALQGILSAFLVSRIVRTHPINLAEKSGNLFRYFTSLFSFYCHEGLVVSPEKTITLREKWAAPPSPDLGLQVYREDGIPIFRATRLPGVPLDVLESVLKPLRCVNGSLIINV